jgi:hypothetical protein
MSSNFIKTKKTIKRTISFYSFFLQRERNQTQHNNKSLFYFYIFTFILRMSTQFRAKSDRVEQSNGSHIVHLVQIDDNNDKPSASAMNELHVTPKISDKGKVIF